ncbi:MAG: peptide chain release factor family protein [Kiritimatiellia bacterium]|jgi:protein subunit release factor B
MSIAPVSPEKKRALEQRMRELGVTESALTEKFILGSGSGGQKLNKSSTCVYLRYPAGGIEIKCQASRSREMNRFLARRELCERLAERIEGARSARQQAAEKIRRQKRRRSRRQRLILEEQKRRHSAKKAARRAVPLPNTD